MATVDADSDAARWQRVQEILGEALELSPPDRARFLEERCDGDGALRAEVESLLAASEGADAYFGDLADRAGLTLSTLTASEGDDEDGTSRGRDPRPDLVGRSIGQYHVLRWLGQGGMASVYLAERLGDGFTQRVAFKVVPKRLSDPDVQRRTNEERAILARLEHRSIARLIDGGLTPEGYPFYAMEYVDGTDVLSYCDERRLTIRERLELFLEVCAPVQFAHERLIVHCDLKPSNIFVTSDGHVKLLDFGVARLVDPDAAGDDVTGLWFTPAYASPEQVRRERPAAASDVYSLGVLLYELLTGHRPYRFDSRLHADVARTVGFVVPPLPSDVVTRPALRTKEGRREEVAAEVPASERGATPETMKKRLRGDLDAIVMKALAKDPDERYHTAEQLSSDLRRHLEHRLVTAVPVTPRYRATKFVLRNRGAVAAAAIVVVALGAGLGATLWQAARATDAAARAQEEAQKAALVAALMADLFRLSDPNEVLGDTVTARDLLDRGAERIRNEFGDQPVVQAELLSEVAAVYRSLGLYRRAEPLARQALELRTAAFGIASLEVSESLIQLGALQADLGQDAAAIETLSRAIDVRTPLVEYPDSQIVRAQRILAWRVRSAQEYDRAAQLFRDALDAQRLLDPESPMVADMMFGLAATYHDSGMMDEADSLLRMVLVDSLPGERPTPMAVSALRNVGMIRRVREQYSDAEPILRRSVEMASRLYGPDHVEVYATQAELGLVLSGTGDWDEAEEILRRALIGSSSVLGTLHPTTGTLQEALGTLLVWREEYDEAVTLLQLGLEEKIQRHQNRDHPGVVASLVRVAEALAGAGRLVEARDYVAQASAMNARLGTVPSVYDITGEQTLGNIAAGRGELEEAEQHFRRAIEIAEQLLGRPDHRYTVWAKRDYGIFLVRAGRRAEAVTTLEWVLEAQIRNLGERHPLVERTRAALRAARGA